VSRRLYFIVESGTDVRLVEGLAERWSLTVLARRIVGGREISQPTAVDVDTRIGSASFVSFAVRAALTILRERRRAGVVLVQGYGLAALCANLAGRIGGVPVVMLVCSPTERYYACRRVEPGGRPFRRIEWWALRLLAAANARLGRRYAVLSPYLASVVRAHGARLPIDVVPVYGVDMRVFAPGSEPRAALRRRLGLPVAASLVFFSSRVAPEKDPDTLLAAVARLRREGRDVRVLHRSGGYDELVRRAHAYGIGEALVAGDALRPGPELADWYRASDLCVQASRDEGLGFSVLEALACGVPVVAAAVGGLRDTIVHGTTGWTYTAGDPAALARAIGRVLDDPAEARRRTVAGRALVARVYARDVVFAELEGPVRRLLAMRTSAPAALVERGL
jgi:glycosyltransferase involved in cell wall biosynthesis